jgi:hypothetical protein
MAMHTGGRKPPNPDPGNYVWVKTKDGAYWRLKRGTLKKAKVNAAYSESIEWMKLSAPAAKRIMQKLQPFTKGFDFGRLNARISGLLRKSLREKGQLDIRYLKELDFQPDHPIGNLLKEVPVIKQTARDIVVDIPLTTDTIIRKNSIVTNYYFELILLYGDAARENGLRTEIADSGVYVIDTDYGKDCRLALILPEQPWIALLKVGCIEGDTTALHARLYGMKVVAAGR